MTQRLYRTQILLEPEQQAALAKVAKREGRSISDLVREMIRVQLAQRSEAEDARRARRLAALDRIREHREELLERRGAPLDLDVTELLADLREEQHERNLASDDRR